MGKFTWEEVASFLEGLVEDGAASKEQEVLYQDYKWYGKKAFKNNYTYIKTIKEMNRLWDEKY